MSKITLRKGFTLAELSVVVFIISIIFVLLITIFRNNLATFRWGQERMNFTQEVQVVMKQIFSDLKQVNPILRQDSSRNILFKGESIGDLFPSLVVIFDKDKKPENGGEELGFYITSLKDFSISEHIKYFIKDGKLIRLFTDYNGKQKRSVMAESASNLYFLEDPGDVRQVRIKLTLSDSKNPSRVENIDFAVRLETDLVCVKTVYEYD